MSELSRFLRYIVPPKDNAEVRPWRWAIFICVIILITDSVSGRGFLGGYGAFAASRDVQIILELQYAETIRNLHLHICSIKPERNATLENTLEDYQRRYDDLTGRRFPLESC